MNNATFGWIDLNPDDCLLVIGFPDDCWACGVCAAELPSHLEDVYGVRTPTGVVIVSMDVPVHTCASLERSDGLAAMRWIADMVQQERARNDSPPPRRAVHRD